MTGKRSLGGGTHRENMVSHMNERKGKRTTTFFQGVTKRCRLSLLTNSALVIRAQMRGKEGVAGVRTMRTAVHIT
jgi:hypothetical protein